MKQAALGQRDEATLAPAACSPQCAVHGQLLHDSKLGSQPTFCLTLRKSSIFSFLQRPITYSR